MVVGGPATSGSRWRSKVIWRDKKEEACGGSESERRWRRGCL